MDEETPPSHEQAEETEGENGGSSPICLPRSANAPRSVFAAPAAKTAGFTLIELLAVMAIIAVMAGVIGMALRSRGTESHGLQSAQATLASLLTLARTEAAVSGEDAVLLVNAQKSNLERFMRHAVAAIWDPALGGWRAVGNGVVLPAGCYLVPSVAPGSGSIDSGESWTSPNTVRSSALSKLVSGSLGLGAVEEWIGLEVSPRGTSFQSGDIVLARGRPNPGDPNNPVVYMNPDNVRGLSVSSYGQITYLNSRNDL